MSVVDFDFTTAAHLHLSNGMTVDAGGSWTCACGNIPEHAGFHMVTRVGDTRIFVQGEGESDDPVIYECGDCGRIIADEHGWPKVMYLAGRVAVLPDVDAATLVALVIALTKRIEENKR